MAWRRFATGIALLCLVTVGAGMAAQMALLPGERVGAALKQGLAALLLGTLYAAARPNGPRSRRLTFPLLSAGLNLLALRAAFTLGALAERTGAPFSTGLAVASGAFAALYVQVAWRWLGAPADGRHTLLAAAGGTAAFGALLGLQRMSDGRFAQALYLSAYWAAWMALVSAAWATAPALTPRARGPDRP